VGIKRPGDHKERVCVPVATRGIGSLQSIMVHWAYVISIRIHINGVAFAATGVLMAVAHDRGISGEIRGQLLSVTD